MPFQGGKKPEGLAMGPRLCGVREFPFRGLLNIFEVFLEFVVFVMLISASFVSKDTNDSILLITYFPYFETIV